MTAKKSLRVCVMQDGSDFYVYVPRSGEMVPARTVRYPTRVFDYDLGAARAWFVNVYCVKHALIPQFDFPAEAMAAAHQENAGA